LPSPLWSSHTPSSSRDLDLTPPPNLDITGEEHVVGGSEARQRAEALVTG
jgi:hypothetical protein